MLLLALFLVGCPKPLPPPAGPPQPIPEPVPELTCGIAEADHDEAVDHIVTALQGRQPLDRWEAKYTHAVVRCVVQEIVEDVHDAPVLTKRAQAWLDGAK